MRTFKTVLFVTASLGILTLAGVALSETSRFDSRGLGHLWNANQPNEIYSSN